MPTGQKRRNSAVFTTLHEDRVPGSWHGHSVFPWAESGKARRQKRGDNNHNRLVTETDCWEGERKEAWPAWGDWPQASASRWEADGWTMVDGGEWVFFHVPPLSERPIPSGFEFFKKNNSVFCGVFFSRTRSMITCSLETAIPSWSLASWH